MVEKLEPQQLASVPLVLTREQAHQLRDLAKNNQNAKALLRAKGLKRSKLRPVSYELGPKDGFHWGDRLELADESVLALAPGDRFQGVNRRKHHLLVVAGPDGWSLEIWIVPAGSPGAFKESKKKRPKEKGERPELHASFVSGGLPSLGKRR